MLEFVPLDFVDNFLLDYHGGHAIALLFVFSIIGTLPVSRKLFSLNLTVFGLLFILVPTAIAPVSYKLLGLLLLVLGPVVYTLSPR